MLTVPQLRREGPALPLHHCPAFCHLFLHPWVSYLSFACVCWGVWPPVCCSCHFACTAAPDHNQLHQSALLFVHHDSSRFASIQPKVHIREVAFLGCQVGCWVCLIRWTVLCEEWTWRQLPLLIVVVGVVTPHHDLFSTFPQKWKYSQDQFTYPYLLQWRNSKHPYESHRKRRLCVTDKAQKQQIHWKLMRKLTPEHSLQ